MLPRDLGNENRRNSNCSQLNTWLFASLTTNEIRLVLDFRWWSFGTLIIQRFQSGTVELTPQQYAYDEGTPK